MEDKVMIWDRQDKKLYPMKERHIDGNREYFKYKGCNLWLEDGIALDVFTIDEVGALIPLKKWRSMLS